MKRISVIAVFLKMKNEIKTCALISSRRIYLALFSNENYFEVLSLNVILDKTQKFRRHSVTCFFQPITYCS